MLILRWDRFESRDLVRLLGISERELRYWAVLGIVKPEISPAAGRPGLRLRYSFKNVVQAGIVQTLLANHISLHAVPTFLRLVNKAGFFLSKPTQLFLVLHQGNLVHMYVRDLRKKAKIPVGMATMMIDLGAFPGTSLGDHLEQLLEDPADRDSLIVIAVHHVRDRLAKQLGKTVADL
jgi:DNA-binding transcriptional MerR regulator